MTRFPKRSWRGKIDWLILLIAGLLEVGWAIGLKYTDGFTELWRASARPWHSSAAWACSNCAADYPGGIGMRSGPALAPSASPRSG